MKKNKPEASTTKIGYCVVRLGAMLSAGAYLQQRNQPYLHMQAVAVALTMQKWADFNQLVAISDPPVEALFVIENGCMIQQSDGTYNENGIYFLTMGRSGHEHEGRANAVKTAHILCRYLNTAVDFCRWYVDEEPAAALAALTIFEGGDAIELLRREEPVHIGIETPAIANSRLGFDNGGRGKSGNNRRKNSGAPPFLFPWIPPADTWKKMLATLSKSIERSAYCVHFTGNRKAVPALVHEADKRQAELSHMLSGDSLQDNEIPLTSKGAVMIRRGLERLSIVEGPTVSARAFVLSEKEADCATLTTIQACLDSVVPGQNGTREMYYGGVETATVNRDTITATLLPSLRTTYGIQEAAGVIRGPAPSDSELPFVRIVSHKEGRMSGTRGNDIAIGVNWFEGEPRHVVMDTAGRFRHMYVVGQTGTGKSTFLSRMIVDDIQRDRGVAVLDPHGTLIDSVLSSFPMRRRKDLILVDLADVEAPVGFNPLIIKTKDEKEYRLRRDVVVQDLYHYVDLTYDMRVTGGPIFESYFRSMLSILLGSRQPARAFTPNLILFRSLFKNRKLRRALSSQNDPNDMVLRAFVSEAEEARGDVSLDNLSPYITSKLVRFVSDEALRNITCQNQSLDFEDIVNNRKILLFHLGKGRIGDAAAGLLASQIVSRIRIETMRRGTGSAHHPFFLYADEFQLFANEQFAELLAEGRKFGLSITVAHQFTRQLPAEVLSAVLGNVGTSVIFRVGGPDAEYLEHLVEPRFDRTDICNLPNFCAYVKNHGNLGYEPFNIHTSLLPSTPNSDIQAIREYARKKHGRPRDVVEKEIADTLEKVRSWAEKEWTKMKSAKGEVSLEDLIGSA